MSASAVAWFKAFLEHGLASWMLIIAAAVLFIIGSERLYFLLVKKSHDSKKALEAIKELILKRDYTKAIQICNNNPGNAELDCVKRGLLSLENGREAIKSSIGAAALDVTHDCENRLPIISLIASAATLLGLFGTIMGLMKTFEAIANADGAEKGKMLGEGIASAMNSTAVGLIIAIIAMVIHTICVSKADSIAGKTQSAGYNLMTWIEQSERSS